MNPSAMKTIVRSIPILLASAALGWWLQACQGSSDSLTGTQPPMPVRQQIILLDIDTLRATHLGAYGYERDTSPVIDRFAAESTRFRRAFSQAPNTPPSQAAILTGLYPSTHGMIYDEDRVPEEAKTLAEAFRDRGFRTAAFVDGGYMNERFGMNQGFEVYDNSQGGGLRKIGPKVLKWIREHRHDNFLLLIHTYDIHTPYASSPEPYRSLFLDGLEEPTPGFVASSEQMEAIRTSIWTDEPKQLPPNDMAWAKALYDGGIRYVDTWIGEFFDELRQLNMYDRALIALFSDHGEEFGEHGSVLHEKLYATVTHVPLILRFPHQAEPRLLDPEVEMIDLMPTLLEWAGVPGPANLQGESLLPLIHGEAKPPYLAFSESPYFGVRRALAFRGHHYLFTREKDQRELYDLNTDFTEQHNLADVKPELAGRMHQAIENWQSMIDNTDAFRAKSGPLDPETYEELKALGYVQ